ncbi:hypothetical protein MHPYR_180099 [uncultured Mycobacterium sp.]|uniref:Uncharacterized protein n=1 Tax=uncultured Mycobacterium sp. TaxID=171292 RepID=A0A1Y5P8N1_9MYCO|nr:hypothetical protein MHPYR_180099 [uncultured Mycobacterium sp.]
MSMFRALIGGGALAAKVTTIGVRPLVIEHVLACVLDVVEVDLALICRIARLTAAITAEDVTGCCLDAHRFSPTCCAANAA